MAINGIDTVLYRVADLALCTRYFDDFGLPPFERDATFTRYRLAEGSNVILKHVADPASPESKLERLGVVETIWGVDREAALERLVNELAGDRDVTRDADGSAHTHDDARSAFEFSRRRRSVARRIPSTRRVTSIALTYIASG